jgi:hypothetical protein
MTSELDRGSEVRRNELRRLALSLLAFVLLAGVGYVLMTAYMR